MIDLYFELDGFRIIYVLIALFMWGVSLLFSREHFTHYNGFMVLTLLATVGVFLSADFMTMFIFFEVMSVSSYVWVAQEETKEALRAGITYLAVAVIGGMVMLMGLFLLYDAVGTLHMNELRSAVQMVWDTKSGQIYAAGFCMLFGFGAKAGMFPLHFWLPKAHPVAPAPASALLSGILTKCGVFGVIFLTVEIFVENEIWGRLILMLGVITMVAGAVLAVFSVNLKRTLACSSVSQIGFILIGIAMLCLLGEHNAFAARGTFLHMVNHSLIKLLLFNCAGIVYMNLHALNLNDIRGFGRKKPFLKVCFLMGALGIGGIPMWNGYVSKTLLHESIVEYIEYLHELGRNVVIFQCVEWAFLISGGLTVAYMLKIFICLFVEKHPDRQEEYDAKTSYMNRLSRCVIGLAAVLLPMMGMFPGITMNRMAEMAMGFFCGGHLEHAVEYLAWVNVKGALISIVIGVFVYSVIIRKLFMKKEGDQLVYVDLWPQKIDVENGFAAVVKGFLAFLGWFCQFLDKLPERIAALFWSQPSMSISGVFKKLDILPEGGLLYLGKSIFAETTEPEENVLVNSLHKKLDDRVETGRIIGSSFSFGLLLACIGLLFTIVYLLIQ